MFVITCDKCGGNLVIDEVSTIRDYVNDDLQYVIDHDIGKLNKDSIQNYIVYTCRKCKSEYKFTYKEWESRYRYELSKQAMEIKKMKAFKSLNPATIKADNGLEFCGQCSGYANDGYCLVDIIKQCIIRKENGI